MRVRVRPRSSSFSFIDFLGEWAERREAISGSRVTACLSDSNHRAMPFFLGFATRKRQQMLCFVLNVYVGGGMALKGARRSSASGNGGQS